MSHRSPLGVVALATAVLLAVASLHAFTVDHRICVEHGEFEHTGHSHEAEHRHHHDAAAVHAAGAEGSAHGHCCLVFIRGTTPALDAEQDVTRIGVTGFDDPGDRAAGSARIVAPSVAWARGPPAVG